jgi:hypothetical protein
MVACAGHLGLVLLLLRIGVFGDVGKEEVGMAVEKVVGVLQIGLALVVGGLGGSRLGRGGVAVVWQHHLTWLIMFWAVRRAMLRGMLAAWSKLDASDTICSTLLGALMLVVAGWWWMARACCGGGVDGDDEACRDRKTLMVALSSSPSRLGCDKHHATATNISGQDSI